MWRYTMAGGFEHVYFPNFINQWLAGWLIFFIGAVQPPTNRTNTRVDTATKAPIKELWSTTMVDWVVWDATTWHVVGFIVTQVMEDPWQLRQTVSSVQIIG